MRDSALFDEAVARFFNPLAVKLGLPVEKEKGGVYEIRSPHFVLRIRLDTGHHRGLNVMLRPASARDFDENKPGIECGIGCFVLFQGEDLKQTMMSVYTDEDFLKQAELLAKASERFGVPYLLGQINDFEAVQEFIRKRGKPELVRIKEMQRNIERSMPNVWQVWTIREDQMPP